MDSLRTTSVKFEKNDFSLLFASISQTFNINRPSPQKYTDLFSEFIEIILPISFHLSKRGVKNSKFEVIKLTIKNMYLILFRLRLFIKEIK